MINRSLLSPALYFSSGVLIIAFTLLLITTKETPGYRNLEERQLTMEAILS